MSMTTAFGCGPGGDGTEPSSLESATLTRVAESIQFGTAPNPTLFRAGGADCRSDRLAVADIAEGVVHVRRGNVWSVVGSKGAGPGELQMPMHPRFIGEDRIMVLDVADGMLELYGLEGEHHTSIALGRRLQVIWDFEPLDDSLIVAVGTQGDGQVQTLAVLSLTDSLVGARSFEIPRRPAGQPEDQIWATQARLSLAVSGRQAYITTPLVDAVYEVELPPGASEPVATAIPIVGYRAPAIPDTAPRDIPELMALWERTDLVSDVFVIGDHLMVPVSGGTYWESEVSAVLDRNRSSGAWVVDSGLAPILGVGDRCGISLRDQASGAAVLEVWVPADR